MKKPKSIIEIQNEKLIECLTIAQVALKNCYCVSSSSGGTNHFAAQEALSRIKVLLENGK